VADQQVGAVGDGRARYDRWHAGSVRDRLARYHAGVGVDDGWVELGDRVFVRRYAFYDQNIGVILGGDDVLVIDTRSTYGQAREIQADLRELTARPVSIVVDTHGHFDHAFGNAVFRPAAIWGHERCVTFMQRTGEARKPAIAAEEPTLADQLAEIVIDPPDRTFADQTTISVGGREVVLRFLGRAHTDHDIVIDVPDADVLFAGDIIEQGAVPFFGDGYPLDWVATSAAVVPLVRGVVVPGHGDHGGRGFAEAQAVSFAALATLGGRVAVGELTLAEAVTAHPFPDLPPEDARAALARAVAQVRGQID
jgi:glyoxylase-like metal-dependent hydrolase (beta-lactamase superfamily II)